MALNMDLLHGMLYILLAGGCFILGTHGESRDLFVSHTGADTDACGKRNHPCKTLVHAIDKSDWDYVIHLENVGGPYVVETPGGRYINLTHSLTVTSSGQGRATVACNHSQVALFDVFKPPGDEHLKTVTLHLNGVSIRNCAHSWKDPGVIRVTDAAVNVKDCEFVNNGVIFDHSQLLDHNCSFVKLDISKCTFQKNGNFSVYTPAINVLTCDNTHVTILNSQLNWSPIKFKARKNLSLTFTDMEVNGKGLPSTSVDITLAPKTNAISFNNCKIHSHTYSHGSPVNIISNHEISNQSSINFNGVTFANNTLTQSTGAALSLLTHLSDTQPQMRASLKHCTFEHNSGRKSSGGAVYIQGISGVHFQNCTFSNNTAEHGGAIYAFNTNDITLTNTTLKDNNATGYDKSSKGQGGAIRTINTDISLSGCHFFNNTAGFGGQAIHLTDTNSPVLTNNTFENHHANQEVFIEQHTNSVNKPLVKFLGNIFIVKQHVQSSGAYYVQSDSDLDYKNNTVCCANSQQPVHTTQTSTEVNGDSKYIRYAQCITCPPGTYKLHSECTSLFDREHFLTDCKPCPKYAACDDGNIRPLKNYWGHEDSNGSLSFHLCPKGYCSPRKHQECDDISSCLGQRSGKLCGVCQQGHLYDIRTKECVPKSSCKYNFKFLLMYSGSFSLIYIVLIMLFSLLSRKKMNFLDASTTTLNVQESLEASSSPGLSPDADPDTSSESFEPSIEYNNSVDSHSLVPIDEETQTSQRSHQNSSNVADRVYTNLVSQSPLVLCVWISLIQLAEDVYKPWQVMYGMQNLFLLDIINFRPIFLYLDTACGEVSLASLSESVMRVVCIGGMFGAVVFIMLLVNAILAIAEKVKGQDFSSKRNCINSFLCHMLMVILVLTHVPLLKTSFNLINCVQLINKTDSVMFLNAEISCHQWWHYLVISFISAMLAPIGLAVWMGLQLLKSDNINFVKFLGGLLLPVVSVFYWECRYGKRICRCLLRYEYVYARMQLESINLDRQVYRTEHAIIDFLSVPFTLDGKSKNQKVGSYAWIIYIFMRSFILVTFSVLLSPIPVVQNLVLFSCFLIAMALHVCFTPYAINLANRVEIGLLGTLTFISVLGLYDSVLYTTGIEPYGTFSSMIYAIDQTNMVLVNMILLEMFIVVFIYSIRACIDKCCH